MKAMIRKITERIQRFLNKPDSTAVVLEDPIIEMVLIGYNTYDEQNGPCSKNFNEDYSVFRHVLVQLYNKVLKDDVNWHFFLEGDYNLLRFSYSFLARVLEVLKEQRVNYLYNRDGTTHIKEWVDEQEATRDHQEHFQKIFHEYSVMAITIEDYTVRKLQNIADRVIHCFYNHQFVNFQDGLRDNPNFESSLMAALTNSRAFYTGTIVAYKTAYAKAKKEIEGEYKERVSSMKETVDAIEKISDVNAAELEDLRIRVAALGAPLEERAIQ